MHKESARKRVTNARHRNIAAHRKAQMCQNRRIAEIADALEAEAPWSCCTRRSSKRSGVILPAASARSAACGTAHAQSAQEALAKDGPDSRVVAVGGCQCMCVWGWITALRSVRDVYSLFQEGMPKHSTQREHNLLTRASSQGHHARISYG